MKTCPSCGEWLRDAASECRFCDLQLETTEDKASGPLREKSSLKSNSSARTVAVILCGVLLLLVGVVFLGYHSLQESRRSVSKNHLQQIGLALHNYNDVFEALPTVSIADSVGDYHHGWQTRILPFIDNSLLYNAIDKDQPWNASSNIILFTHEVPAYLMPGVHRRRDKSGLALTHYSGNINVFRHDSTLLIESITDGASTTLMAGETEHGFRPWGQPRNWRDPGLGLNRGEQSFGSPLGDVQFLFCDGKVRSLSKDIDPTVLQALSTPAGNEPVGGY